MRVGAPWKFGVELPVLSSAILSSCSTQKRWRSGKGMQEKLQQISSTRAQQAEEGSLRS